jgi:hypothetical protein
MAQGDIPEKWLIPHAAGKMEFQPDNGAIKSMLGFDDYMEREDRNARTNN